MAKASQTSARAASVELRNSCPAWCEEDNCKGEHFGATQDYVPATAGTPEQLDYSMGVSFPAVSAALRWNTIDHCQPAVSLHINGFKVDTEIEMQLHEAEALLESLKRNIKTLRKG
jgi:hypothetical protein